MTAPTATTDVRNKTIRSRPIEGMSPASAGGTWPLIPDSHHPKRCLNQCRGDRRRGAEDERRRGERQAVAGEAFAELILAPFEPAAERADRAARAAGCLLVAEFLNVAENDR